jgi:hypothetical protein
MRGKESYGGGKYVHFERVDTGQQQNNNTPHEPGLWKKRGRALRSHNPGCFDVCVCVCT